ncbi:MAG: hypothetical protein WEF86_10460 [Gemmatimonadota bacterium]
MRSSSADPRRPGFSLAELIVGLVIAGLIGTLLLGMLLAQMRVARHTARRSLDNDAVRTVVAVLAGELHRASPEDVRNVAADSIVLRAFRGAGLPCAAAAGTVTVRYRGDRLPAPDKDSVLVIFEGRSRVLPFVESRAAPASCRATPGESLLVWAADEAAGNADVLLVFESGRYFLTARALRYRLGAEGRQPLTAEAFRPAGTQFIPVGDPRAVHFGLAAGERSIDFFAARVSPPPHR